MKNTSVNGGVKIKWMRAINLTPSHLAYKAVILNGGSAQA